jgi:hypothetical protein
MSSKSQHTMTARQIREDLEGRRVVGVKCLKSTKPNRAVGSMHNEVVLDLDDGTRLVFSADSYDATMGVIVVYGGCNR